MRAFLSFAILFLIGNFSLQTSFAQTERLIPYELEPITIDNAERLEELAILGQGRLSGSDPLAWSPDGQTLAVSAGAGIWLFDTAQFNAEPRLIPSHIMASNITFSPDSRLIAAITHGEGFRLVTIWDAQTGQVVHDISSQACLGVGSIGFSPDGDTLMSSGQAGGLCLWDVETGELTTQWKDSSALDPQDSYPGSAVFTSDGQTIAFGYISGKIYLWDVQTQRLVAQLQAPQMEIGIQGITAQPNSSSIAVANGAKIYLWDIQTHELIRTFEVTGQWEDWTLQTQWPRFSADGTKLVVGATNRKVYLWDVETGSLLQSFEGHEHLVNQAVISPDASQVASFASLEDSIRVWDVDTGQQVALLEFPFASSNLTISADNQWLAATSHNGRVMLWDLKTHRETIVNKPSVSYQAIASAAFHPSRPLLLYFSSAPYTLNWYDAATGASTPVIVDFEFISGEKRESPVNENPLGEFYQLHLSPDGRTLVYAISEAALGTTFKSLDFYPDRLSIRQLYPHEWLAQSVAFNHDGTRLAIDNGSLNILATNSMSRIGVLSNQGSASTIAYSPDSQQVASGFSNGEITLWDANSITGVPIKTLQMGFGNSITDVAFSSDKSALAATTDYNMQLFLWDLRPNFEQRVIHLYEPTEPRPIVKELIFSRDGKLLITGNASGTIGLWGVGAMATVEPTISPTAEPEVQAEAQDPTSSPTPDTFSSLTRILLAIGGFLIALVGLLLIFRRSSKPKRKKKKTSDKI